ncbi:hypothetical protein HZA33_04865 [Candidatus Pacearchaeota archaeon]|nr:hypothetical protein [Candidatus Pacearchaeota archaeon]
MTEDEEIERLLLQGNQEKKTTLVDLIPPTVPFTTNAFKKADMIGPLVEKIGGRDYEWSAFLLAQKQDPNYIVRDVFLQRGQRATQGCYEGEVCSGIVIDGKGLSEANKCIEDKNKKEGTNYYVIGWIHGHGNAYHLGHSGTDFENFGIVLNSNSLNTEREVRVPLSLIETEVIKSQEDGKITFSGKSAGDALIEYGLSEAAAEKILRGNGIDFTKDNLKEKAMSLLDSLLSSTDMKCYQSNILGFSYFVIMSNKHIEPYASIGTISQRAITKTSSAKLIKSKISRVRVEDDIKVDRKGLEKEIEECVEFPYHYTSKFIGFPGAGTVYYYVGDKLVKGISKLVRGPNLVSGKGVKGKKIIVGKRAENETDDKSNVTQCVGQTKNGLWISSRVMDSILGKMQEYLKENKREPGDVMGFIKMLLDLDGTYKTPSVQDQIIESYFKERFSNGEEQDED